MNKYKIKQIEYKNLNLTSNLWLDLYLGDKEIGTINKLPPIAENEERFKLVIFKQFLTKNDYLDNHLNEYNIFSNIEECKKQAKVLITNYLTQFIELV